MNRSNTTGNKSGYDFKSCRTEILEQEAVTPRLGLEYFDLVEDFPTSRRKHLQRLRACGTCMVHTGRALKHEYVELLMLVWVQ